MAGPEKTPRTHSLLTGRRLEQVVEAILFLGGEKVTVERLVASLHVGGREPIERAIASIRERYRRQRRPYQLSRSGKGYAIVLDAAQRDRLRAAEPADKGIKLPRATIEVLAIVAYRQPITRTAIEVSSGLDAGPPLRQLLRRDLVSRVAPAEAGAEPSYATTDRFLKLFQLEDLSELPAAEDLAS